MSAEDIGKSTYTLESEASGAAPDIASAAALLEIGDRLGILDFISTGQEINVEALAAVTTLPEEGVANYLKALEAAAILEEVPEGGGTLRTVSDFELIRHQAGYVSWTMNANRPFIEYARDFLIDPERARKEYTRDGRQVAVSSQWMGSMAFYPAALKVIFDARPEYVADLGAGTCRLLIEILLAFPQATGMGLDIDAGACREAERAAERVGVADRLTVVERAIESLATDPSPIEGAQVIHAGFVFHDMMPEEEHIADAVLANCRDALRQGGIMAITDAVPYVRNSRERRFSSIVTYFHQQFMGRKLLNETEWQEKLLGAGFSNVECILLAFPTGRLFVARR
jgi:SAM-dependent methyltransferase